jgi:hypothetical protein
MAAAAVARWPAPHRQNPASSKGVAEAVLDALKAK